MAIDGTWRRPCALKEVSDSGATLVIEGSVQGLNLKEFFLLLSSTGLAYRRCEMGWMNGDQLADQMKSLAEAFDAQATVLKRKKKKKKKDELHC